MEFITFEGVSGYLIFFDRKSQRWPEVEREADESEWQRPVSRRLRSDDGATRRPRLPSGYQRRRGRRSTETKVLMEKETKWYEDTLQIRLFGGGVVRGVA